MESQYGNVDEELYVTEVLKEGRNVIVEKAKNKQQKLFVIKRYQRSPSISQIAQNEYQILRDVNHQNIIKLHSIKRNSIYVNNNSEQLFTALVFEYIDGSNFWKKLQIPMIGQIQENIARKFISEIIDALTYLHKQRKCAHGQISPFNILYTQNYHIKIIGFGSARRLDSDKQVQLTKNGFSPFIAPEMYKKCKLTVEADIFAVGVLLYQMVIGIPPFNSSRNTINKNTNFQAIWVSSRKKQVDSDFKDLFQKLVSYLPQQRLKLEQIKNSVWFKKGDTLPSQEYIKNYFLKRKQQIDEKAKENHKKAMDRKQRRQNQFSHSQTRGHSTTSSDEIFLQERQKFMKLILKLEQLKIDFDEIFVLNASIDYTYPALISILKSQPIPLEIQSETENLLQLVENFQIQIVINDQKIQTKFFVNSQSEDQEQISKTKIFLSIDMIFGLRNSKPALGLKLVEGDYFYFYKIAKIIKNNFSDNFLH